MYEPDDYQFHITHLTVTAIILTTNSTAHANLDQDCTGIPQGFFVVQNLLP